MLLKPLMVEDMACLSLLNGKSNLSGPTTAQTK